MNQYILLNFLLIFIFWPYFGIMFGPILAQHQGVETKAATSCFSYGTASVCVCVFVCLCVCALVRACARAHVCFEGKLRYLWVIEVGDGHVWRTKRQIDLAPLRRGLYDRLCVCMCVCVCLGVCVCVCVCTRARRESNVAAREAKGSFENQWHYSRSYSKTEDCWNIVEIFITMNPV